MRTYALALVAAIGLFAGCASEPKPTSEPKPISQPKPSGTVAENTVEAQATVTAIDLPQRIVTLRLADGTSMLVQASEAVYNLPQVRVGDMVKVTYTEALAWQVKAASEGTASLYENVSADRAPPGQKPGGRVGRTVTLTTTITAIDTAQGTVTLRGPEGNSRTIKVADPANLSKVQVGDLVAITYSEAVAVSVQPVGSK